MDVDPKIIQPFAPEDSEISGRSEVEDPEPIDSHSSRPQSKRLPARELVRRR